VEILGDFGGRRQWRQSIRHDRRSSPAPTNSSVTDGGQTARVGTNHHLIASKPGMDKTERETIRAEGPNPDDPAVVPAIDFVRWLL
jgi:hypothetical protein